MSPTVTVIIVNWNSGSLLASSVDSLVRHHGGLVDSIIVVDNDSQDDSISQLSKLNVTDVGLRIIENRTNTGFARACNQAQKLATGKYLLFLNPDTRIFTGSLAGPIEFLERAENACVGAVGIQLIEDDGRVSRSCARFPTLWRFVAEMTGAARIPGLKGTGVVMAEWSHDATRIVDHVIGAFLLIRKEIFEILGGFDEQFFLYLEDVDLSWRMKELGYTSVYLASAQAFHKGGGTSAQIKATRLFYSLRSKIIYGHKHFGRASWLCLVVLTLIYEPTVRCIYALSRGRVDEVVNTAKGYWMLLRNFRELWRLPASQ